MMNIDDQQRTTLKAICEDHRECLREVDFHVCGQAMMARLRRHGIEVTLEDHTEVEQKAKLLWECDQMIELLKEGKGGSND